jgi:hypothetical protein
MDEQAPGLASLLDNLGITVSNVSLLTIGLTAADMPGIEAVHAYETLSGTEELPKDLRVQLGIVVARFDSMSRTGTERLLARLRDVHCEKVLLLDTGSAWAPADLRSLGYLEIKRPQVDGRCYLFDPDQFNQPREWNNPSDWANPENFRKYRW